MGLLKSRWGKWIDLSTGAVAEDKYLLQARRHKNGKIQFRVASAKSAWCCDKPTIEQLKEVK